MEKESLDSDDDFRSGCRNVSHHYRQQSFSGLHSPGRSNCTITCYPRVQTIYCSMENVHTDVGAFRMAQPSKVFSLTMTSFSCLTVSAAVRLIPRPPARVLSKNTKMSALKEKRFGTLSELRYLPFADEAEKGSSYFKCCKKNISFRFSFLQKNPTL